MTSLLVKDYLANEMWTSPLAFAIEQYIHYPLNRIGLNPPGFYAFSGPWMLAFGDSRTSVLLFQIAWVVGLAAVACRTAQHLGFGIGAALLSLLLVSLPAVRLSYQDLYLDVATTLIACGALISWYAYLNHGRNRAAYLFGLFAAAALLVKGTALFLALVPALSIMLTRRFDLLKRPSFWISAGIVLLIAGPWYILTSGLIAEAARDFVSPWTKFFGYFWVLVKNLGWVGLCLLCIGLGERTRYVLGQSHDTGANTWAVVLSAFAAVLLFQSFAQVAALDRYMVPVLGLALLLIWAGAEAVFRLAVTRYPAFGSGLAQRVFVPLLVLVSIVPALDLAQMAPRIGAGDVAREVASLLPETNPTLLIGSNNVGEGAVTSALVSLDPDHSTFFVIRGGRLFDKGGMMAHDYQATVTDADQVMQSIDALAISLVVVDMSAPSQALQHNRLLKALVEARPERFKVIWMSKDDGRPGWRPISVYRVEGVDGTARIDRLREVQAPHRLSM
ncbi:MAG: ArnT family glycosyltransferase [Alphaproteobacteria bacterium]